MLLILSRIDVFLFFFSSRRRHTRFKCDWSSDVCSSDLSGAVSAREAIAATHTLNIGKRHINLVFLFLRRLPQFALQGKRTAACLKILRIILAVVQVDELLIGLDGFGLL